MIEIAAARPLARLRFRDASAWTWLVERRWLVTMAATSTVELVWWSIAWRLGFAPLPHIGIYLGLAFGGLGAAIVLRLTLRLSASAAPWGAALPATLLVGIGASAFLPLKYAIPQEVSFWLDRPLASAERSWFGADPWMLLDRLFGWAAVPLDWLYGCWLPTQSLVLFLVILARPSPAKSRALMAYSIAWFLLGILGAVLLSSAGPVFYDRMYGGSTFAALGETLRARRAWIAIAESDRMWAAAAAHDPGMVAGISAMPSIHVAISLWMWLVARDLCPRVSIPAFLYFVLVWLGSVQLGWHYVSDGIAGVIGMLAVWSLAGVNRSEPHRRCLLRSKVAVSRTAVIDPKPSGRASWISMSKGAISKVGTSSVAGR